MSDFVLFERDDAVVTLTLNRPEERNALSTQANWDEIVACCERVRTDPTVKVVILTGAGSAFSAGGNVKDMRDKKGISAGNPYAIMRGYQNGIQRIPLALYDLDVPTIAAVNGPAIGAGCSLALACDLRIAGQSASFAASFINVALVPGSGCTFMLPRLVGLGRAAEMTFTGRKVGAAEALRIGLVDQVVPDGKLLAESKKLARRLADKSAPVLAMIKDAVNASWSSDLETQLKLEEEYQAAAGGMRDHREAVKAFMEKRPPRFEGR